MSQVLFDLYCSACKQQCHTITEDFTSPCCYEPFVTKAGADINADMIFEWLDDQRKP